MISFTGKKSKWWKYSARQAASLKDHGQKWKREILGDWGKESWVWRKDFWPSMKEKGYAQKKIKLDECSNLSGFWARRVAEIGIGSQY